MKESTPNIIIIPAKKEASNVHENKRQLRAAAYCRVSTDEEEQLTSYEAQKNYYTDYIMKNPDWTMAGIFADEGITGTSAKKRPEFLRMIRLCKMKKIDIILTKSISRFARNTVDCLNYIRILKELGIAVIFEKENINTLNSESEILITLMGAFAQAESESISANVRWGKRQAMREGKVVMQYKKLYAFQRGENGQPEIIPEQAEVVKAIYKQYLMGASIAKIKKALQDSGVRNASGGTEWTESAIRSILTNEKYCGDALLQKTYTSDCISRKVIRNTGQLPMYLVQNHHEPIVSRETFDAVQTELARRNAGRSPSKKYAPTGKAIYSSKYALSERLVCGECGTLYRRCTWSKNGKKRIVWRCVSRLDYGTKYCHKSPSMDEGTLQKSILSAINSTMSNKLELINRIRGAMESKFLSTPDEEISLAEIEMLLENQNEKFQRLLSKAADRDAGTYTEQFRDIVFETAALKERKKRIEELNKGNVKVSQQITRALEAMQNASAELTEWDEPVIRQLVDTVKVVSADEIIVYLRGGAEIRQDIVR